MAEQSEGLQIAEMEAIARLFADTTVRNAVERLRQDYAARMLAAKTADDREKVWLSARALEDLLLEFQSVSQNGKLAKIKQQKAREAKQNAPKPLPPRPGTPPVGK